MESSSHLSGRKQTRFRLPLHSFSLLTLFVITTVVAIVVAIAAWSPEFFWTSLTTTAVVVLGLMAIVGLNWLDGGEQ